MTQVGRLTFLQEMIPALNNGATKEETMEVFHHASGYCGLPAANGSVRIGVEVFRELGLLD